MRVSCPRNDYDTDEREEDFGIMKKRSPFNRGGAMDSAAESLMT